MKSFIVDNDWTDMEGIGWGNGYIAIPTTSSWHGVDGQHIPVETHGGRMDTVGLVKDAAKSITDQMPSDIYKGDWLVGFHTCSKNYGYMRKEMVAHKTKLLLSAMVRLNATPYVKEIRQVVVCRHCGSNQDVTHLKDHEWGDVETQLFTCGDCSKNFYFSI
jgi:hypothetical protein